MYSPLEREAFPRISNLYMAGFAAIVFTHPGYGAD